MTTLAFSRFRYQGASLAGFCSCKTCISAIHGGHYMRRPVKNLQRGERDRLKAPLGGAWRTLLRRSRACQWNDHYLRTTPRISARPRL